MDKLAGEPLGLIGANIESAGFFLVFLDSLGVGSQVRDDLVVLVEQGDSGHQFGDQKQIAVGVAIGRPQETVESLAVFSGE